MINIPADLVIKVGLFILAFTGFIVGLLKAWRLHDRKLVSHDERLEDHEKKIDTMEKDFKEEIGKLESKFDVFIADNKRSHEKLHDELGSQGKILSKLDGYLTAKKEDNGKH